MSDFFQWDAGRYTLGIAAMDEEHRQLVSLMNKLHAAHEQGLGPRQLAAAFDALAESTVKHFRDEEAYMECIGYPGLRTHQGVHRNLLKRVGEFREELRQTQQLSPQFFAFLKMWLGSHICGVDTQYAAHQGARRAG